MLINCAQNSIIFLLFKIALKTLSNSEYHFTKAQEATLPQKIDLFTFMKVADEVLGIKPQ